MHAWMIALSCLYRMMKQINVNEISPSEHVTNESSWYLVLDSHVFFNVSRTDALLWTEEQ